MRNILAGILCAVAAHAITIIGPSGIGNTEASIRVPDNIMDIVAPGGFYQDADTDLYDQTYTYTVTGGTGAGWLFFDVTGLAMPVDFIAGVEAMNSIAWVIAPFQVITPPGDYKQGAVPVFCGGAVAAGRQCSLQFEFGVPLTVRWRVRSTVSYAYSRIRLTDIARLRGLTISASTNIDLSAVGTGTEATGITLIPDAVVTIAPVPEPGRLAAAGSAAVMAAKWFMGRRPARNRR